MYCTNCGKKLEENETTCQNCGNQTENKNNIQTISKEDNNKANKLNNIVLILLFSPIIVALLCSFIKIALPLNIFIYTSILTILSSLILLIYIRIKYQKNNESKTTLIVLILVITLEIIPYIIILSACSKIADDLGG